MNKTMANILMTTSAHVNHDTEWICPGSKPNTLVCIACKFNIMQDQEELSIKKRVVLSEFVSVLSSNNEQILEILTSKCDFTQKFLILLLCKTQQNQLV